MKKIGIQGIKGSYHDQVAKSYFGDSISINEFFSDMPFFVREYTKKHTHE